MVMEVEKELKVTSNDILLQGYLFPWKNKQGPSHVHPELLPTKQTNKHPSI